MNTIKRTLKLIDIKITDKYIVDLTHCKAKD